jgi:hypothetical protein
MKRRTFLAAAALLPRLARAAGTWGPYARAIVVDALGQPATVLTDEVRRAHREDVERRRKLGIAAPNEDPDVFLHAPDLNTPRRLETLALMLAKRGHPDARIAKVLGENFARLFREVWG